LVSRGRSALVVGWPELLLRLAGPRCRWSLGTGSALVDGRGAGSGPRDRYELRMWPGRYCLELCSVVLALAEFRERLLADAGSERLGAYGVAEELGLLRGLWLHSAPPAGWTSCLELGALDVDVPG
jgi:hypothetical protein